MKGLLKVFGSSAILKEWREIELPKGYIAEGRRMVYGRNEWQELVKRNTWGLSRRISP